jgi:anaerobic selenocysteine-containing dehydrogenase
MSMTRTTCNRDCPDVCTIEVYKDESGRALRLKGSAEDPITRGFLCERTNRFLERQYADDRLVQPMWRPQKGGQLEPVSWDFALDLCAEKLQAARTHFGPASILHYRSGGSLGLLKKLGDLLFEKFGGAGEAAQELDFGVCESHALSDLENSKTILNWGKNIHTSGVHLLPVLVEARRRGTKVITVDCVRTRSAAISDCFIQPRPGTDHALALGALGLLLERGFPLCAGLLVFDVEKILDLLLQVEQRSVIGVAQEGLPASVLEKGYQLVAHAASATGAGTAPRFVSDHGAQQHR